MGVGRALLFGFIGAIPGVVLALIGWVISGSPEEWGSELFLACYLPFFGCVAAGIAIGFRGEVFGAEG